MDDAMIERCADALSRAYVNNSFKGMTIAVIKAMREPTEKMQRAGVMTMPDYDPQVEDAADCWQAMIDSITND